MDKSQDIYWVGISKKELLKCPKTIRQRIGFQLFKLQNGDSPDDFKPMESIGKGVYEVRIEDNKGNNVGRCFYVAKFKGRIYVLHAFVKKSQRTPKKNIDLGKTRYKEMMIHLQKTRKR